MVLWHFPPSTGPPLGGGGASTLRALEHKRQQLVPRALLDGRARQLGDGVADFPRDVPRRLGAHGREEALPDGGAGGRSEGGPEGGLVLCEDLWGWSFIWSELGEGGVGGESEVRQRRGEKKNEEGRERFFVVLDRFDRLRSRRGKSITAPPLPPEFPLLCTLYVRLLSSTDSSLTIPTTNLLHPLTLRSSTAQNARESTEALDVSTESKPAHRPSGDDALAPANWASPAARAALSGLMSTETSCSKAACSAGTPENWEGAAIVAVLGRGERLIDGKRRARAAATDRASNGRGCCLQRSPRTDNSAVRAYQKKAGGCPSDVREPEKERKREEKGKTFASFSPVRNNEAYLFVYSFSFSLANLSPSLSFFLSFFLFPPLAAPKLTPSPPTHPFTLSADAVPGARADHFDACRLRLRLRSRPRGE